MKKSKDITLGIFGNTNKAEVSKLLVEIVEYLVKNNISFYADNSLAKVSPAKDKKHFKSAKDIVNVSDFILSLGGDGTFLNTARIAGNTDIPIIGVNLGRLGFFSEVGPDEIVEFIPKLIQNKFRITEEVIIKSVTDSNKALYALNDIVIDKNDSVRMLELETFYNDEKVVRIISDGIIISTPAGSTGYSLSCNGPIVNPDSKVFIITPISPHTLNVRPIIVPDDGIIKIKIYKEGKARIASDGQNTQIVKSPSEIILSKADYTIKVIKKLNSTYFKTLKHKLFWNVDKRYS
ncbi:MAG: NAD(+)/NADH kinase [Ignavibacteria bacterium]|nr:NAD(+)/NADH kinase [Ignavibacteria bacterium]